MGRKNPESTGDTDTDPPSESPPGLESGGDDDSKEEGKVAESSGTKVGEGDGKSNSSEKGTETPTSSASQTGQDGQPSTGD